MHFIRFGRNKCVLLRVCWSACIPYRARHFIAEPIKLNRQWTARILFYSQRHSLLWLLLISLFFSSSCCSFVICVLFRRRLFEMPRCVFAYLPLFFSLSLRIYLLYLYLYTINTCVFCVKRIVAILLCDKTNSLLQSKRAFAIRYAFFMLLTRQSRLFLHLFIRTNSEFCDAWLRQAKRFGICDTQCQYRIFIKRKRFHTHILWLRVRCRTRKIELANNHIS